MRKNKNLFFNPYQYLKNHHWVAISTWPPTFGKKVELWLGYFSVLKWSQGWMVDPIRPWKFANPQINCSVFLRISWNFICSVIIFLLTRHQQKLGTPFWSVFNELFISERHWSHIVKHPLLHHIKILLVLYSLINYI